jgi:hypothetical protein
MRIALGSDQAGFELEKSLPPVVEESGHRGKSLDDRFYPGDESQEIISWKPNPFFAMPLPGSNHPGCFAFRLTNTSNGSTPGRSCLSART